MKRGRLADCISVSLIDAHARFATIVQLAHEHARHVRVHGMNVCMALEYSLVLASCACYVHDWQLLMDAPRRR